MNYLRMDNPFLKMGKKLYDLCMMYQMKDDNLEEFDLPDLSIVKEVMDYVLDYPMELDCANEKEILKRLIVNYHIHAFQIPPLQRDEYVMELINLYEQIQQEENSVTAVEEAIIDNILGDLRKQVVVSLIERCQSLEQFQDHLQMPVLSFFYDKNSFPFPEIMEQDRTVIEELFMAFIEHYVYYLDRECSCLQFEQGWSQYEFYQKEFGNSIMLRYQAFDPMYELSESLRSYTLQTETKELPLAWFILSYQQFLDEHYALFDELYIPSLFTYMKKKNPDGYRAIQHVLLKISYLYFKILPSKTKEQNQIIKRIEEHQLSEKSWLKLECFLPLFEKIMTSSSLQEKILKEKDKPYVKKFDQYFENNKK